MLRRLLPPHAADTAQAARATARAAAMSRDLGEREHRSDRKEGRRKGARIALNVGPALRLGLRGQSKDAGQMAILRQARRLEAG
eukprot:5911301-Prymnesium_polylepis.2